MNMIRRGARQVSARRSGGGVGSTRCFAHPEAFPRGCQRDEPSAYIRSASMTMSRSATGKPGPELVNSFVTSLNCFEMSSRERLKSIAPRGVRASQIFFPSSSSFSRANGFDFFFFEKCCPAVLTNKQTRETSRAL